MRIRPAISIITPTYNRRTSLERAIHGVRRQTLADYEHVIVDDCSRDDTESYVRGLEDPRIRYVRFDHWRGANEARNVGIEIARSKLLTFLDSDDEFLPHRLESTVNRLDDFAAPELLISSFQTIKKGRPRPAENPGVYLSGPELEQALMTYAVFIAGTSITVRRRTILRSGGFEPTLRRLQDREALLKLSRHCGAQLLPQVDWIKHPSPDSISGPRAGYVESLGAMLDVHPDLAEKHRKMVGYQIARHILADALRGRWRQVRRSLQANRRAKTLRFSILEMAAGYRAGASQRRSLSAAWKQQAQEDCIHFIRPAEDRVRSSRLLRRAA